MNKRIGIISYNIYGNFTNYGSALQSWAIYKTLESFNYETVLVDYCPDIHLDKNMLNPLEKMWDQDEESILNTRLSLPAIEENFWKFDTFFNTKFNKTLTKYNSSNFENIKNENFDGFLCGSDTIFSIDETKGFDNGFFANFDVMKNHSISYAASFGDSKLSHDDLNVLEQRLKNFKAIGLRETRMLNCVSSRCNCPVQKTIDPTLLLKPDDYNELITERAIKEEYLLLYTRRYNNKMQKYAENMASKHGWKIVEISLRFTNSNKGHIMMYNAGVEEFLSLLKNASYVVTNSFHGLLFSVQFKKQFAVFSRETGDSKISEVLELFGLQDHLLNEAENDLLIVEDYDSVHNNIQNARTSSISFLKKELELL